MSIEPTSFHLARRSSTMIHQLHNAIFQSRTAATIGCLKRLTRSRTQVPSMRMIQRFDTTHRSPSNRTSSSLDSPTNTPTTLPNEDNPRVKIIPHSSSGITHVVLSRPSKLNSLDLCMFESIAEVGLKLRTDKSCRAVILRGEGKAFCTGLDVKSLACEEGRWWRRWSNSSFQRLLDRPSGYSQEEKGWGNLAQDVAYLWRQVPVPVIAVLHGMCFGGGMQIALGADFRFSTPDCQMSIMESRWGLIPDMSASVTLRELVRMDVAKELAMTGRILSGEEGARLGLVTRCVDDPMEEAVKVAREIVERSPDSVAATKALFHTTWVANEETCLQKETDLQWRLIKTYNQMAASGRQLGLSLPYVRRQDWEHEA